MFNPQVHWWQWGISQAFAVGVLIFVVLAYNSKARTKTLLFLGISFSLYAVSFAFLEDWIAVGITTVIALRSFTLFFLEKYNVRQGSVLSIIVLVLFLILTGIVMWLAYEWWFDWILLTAALIMGVAAWVRNIHPIRIAELVFASTLLVNNILHFSIVGIVIEVVVLSAVVAFYIRFFKDRQNKNDLNQ